MEKGWKDIGYHFVINNGFITFGNYLSCLDGMIECGRFLDGDNVISDNEIGAHALGYNNKSIGICLVGRENFTVSQMDSLVKLLKNLMDIYGVEPQNILGHCETESGKAQGKTCPNFCVRDIRTMFMGG